MNKIIKLLTLATVLSAVGITYAAYTLKDFPEAFDWEDEEEENYE
jgi:hypothetical protein